MAGGIKREALSINDKLDILKQYDERCFAKTQIKIAKELNVPSSTLRTLLKKRKEIEENAVEGGCKRKKVKKK